MRQIEIIEDVRVRFPGRDAEFDLGVEIGAIVALMALGQASIDRVVSQECVEQLRPLAERFAYALVATPVANGLHVSVTHRSRRPRLRVV